MITERIRNAIDNRRNTDDEWEFGVEQCWEQEINILSEDIQQTIAFLDNECTADEFSWLSEIFERVAEKTQSRDFIECLYRVAQKFPEECKTYNVFEFIRDAEQHIETDQIGTKG